MTTLLFLVLLSNDAWACSCAGPVPTSRLSVGASAVFIGKVTEIKRPTPVPNPVTANADGSVNVSFGVFSLSSQVRFSVERAFKGLAGGEVTLSRDGSTCGYPFVEGATYLVIAYSVNGVLSANKCARPLPLSQAGAAVKYLEAVQANRPIAILHGLALRQAADSDGKPVLQKPMERFTVRAEAPGLSFEVVTNEADEFELAVPPGNYHVWLIRNGQSASAPQAVRLAAGESTLRILSAFPTP